MPMAHQFILTTVGISLLINCLTKAERDEGWVTKLNRQANAQELPLEVKNMVEQLAARTQAELDSGDVACRRRLSAELNGLYGLYDSQLQRAIGDVHILVTTDTALGIQSSRIIEMFLRRAGMGNVQCWIPRQLSSADNLRFSHGIKDLLRQCEETIPGYRESGYRIVFNLTGAFKSLQSYLNIAGMFYADEIVYIFEGSDQLLRIPRLPIQVDTGKLREHRVPLALLDVGAIVEQVELPDLPEGLLEVDQHGHATLSEWGRLIWNRARRELLGDQLLEFPHLVPEDSFRRDFDRASVEERFDLHLTLAQVSNLLQDGGVSRLKQDSGLQYEDYVRSKTHNGQPIGHFRLTQSRRVSCVADGKTLRLRHFGNHDQVNDNP